MFSPINAHNARLIISAAHSSQFPETDQFEVVMAGKSNVGKSSLINALTNRKKLAYVGQRPGKTRLINFYHINDDLLLVDVPGYGYANRSHSEQIEYGKLMDGYFSLRNPRLMLILIDIRRGLSQDDVMMIEFAEHNEIPAAIVLTKTDKLSHSKVIQCKRKIEKEIDMDVFLFTSLNGESVLPLSEYIVSLMNEEKAV